MAVSDEFAKEFCELDVVVVKRGDGFLRPVVREAGKEV